MGIRVPTTTRQSVARTALPSTRVSTQPRSFRPGPGQDVGAAAGELARTIGGIVEQESLRADEVAVNEAMTRSEVSRNTIEADAFNTRGKNAINISESTLKQYTDVNTEIEKDLFTDRQKEMFQRSTLRRSLDLDRRLRLHESREFERHDSQTSEARISQLRRSAIQNTGNDAAIILDVAESNKLILERGLRAGQSEEFIEGKQFEETRLTYMGVLNKRIDGGDIEGVQEELNSGKFDQILESEGKRKIQGRINSIIQVGRNRIIQTERDKIKDPWLFLDKTGQTETLIPVQFDENMSKSFIARQAFVDDKNKEHKIRLPILNEKEVNTLQRQFENGDPSEQVGFMAKPAAVVDNAFTPPVKTVLRRNAFPAMPT